MKITSVDLSDPRGGQRPKVRFRTDPPMTKEIFTKMLDMGYYEQELALDGEILIWNGEQPIAGNGIDMINQRLSEAEEAVLSAETAKNRARQTSLDELSKSTGLPIFRAESTED